MEIDEVADYHNDSESPPYSPGRIQKPTSIQYHAPMSVDAEPTKGRINGGEHDNPREGNPMDLETKRSDGGIIMDNRMDWCDSPIAKPHPRRLLAGGPLLMIS